MPSCPKENVMIEMIPGASAISSPSPTRTSPGASLILEPSQDIFRQGSTWAGIYQSTAKAWFASPKRTSRR
ncbi:hypothetical protein BD779DRAFT_1557197, partial [Infundibulicybe gibba]